MLPSPGGVPWWVFWPVSIGALTIGVRQCYRAAKSAGRGIATAWRKVGAVVKIASTLVDIAEQFRPNGGASFSDKIDRIEQHATYASAAIPVLTRKIDDVSEKLDTNAAAIEASSAQGHELHDDFEQHKADDVQSFSEVKGLIAAVHGSVDGVGTQVQTIIDRRTDGAT